MEITLIEARESYLFAAGTGPFDPARAMELLKVVVDAAVAHQRSKILIDFTRIEGDLSILTLYELGIKTANIGTGISHLALIDRPERILPDRFWQNVVRNNGLNAKVCGNFAEAEAWLLNRTRSGVLAS